MLTQVATKMRFGIYVRTETILWHNYCQEGPETEVFVEPKSLLPETVAAKSASVLQTQLQETAVERIEKRFGKRATLPRVVFALRLAPRK